MKYFYCFGASCLGGLTAAFIGLAVFHFSRFQPIIGAAFAVAGTIGAAVVAWVSVQKQIAEQRRQGLGQSLEKLYQFRDFINSAAEELQGYKSLANKAAFVHQQKEEDYDATITEAQRIPFSIPSNVEPLINYKTRTSIEALNSYIIQYEQLIIAIIEKNGLPLTSVVLDPQTKHKYDRILQNSATKAEQVISDLAEFDSTDNDKRIDTLQREIASL